MHPVATLKYVVGELRENYDDLLWWRSRLITFLVAPIHLKYYGTHGVDVMSESWDNLLVLDGCRADLFEDTGELAWVDNYNRVTSRASMTREWTRKNFSGGEFGDTIYISANPYVSRVAGNAFHEIVDVWDTHFDESVGTVPPESVADAVREARDAHPDKRLIVHFMQPHYPFLDHPELTFDSWKPENMRDEVGGHSGKGPHNVWQALELGLVERETVWSAYANNLQRVLGVALPLSDEIEGRTVITSDHGNMLGERAWPIPIRIFGHPPNLRSPELVEVPWAVREGDRRNVTDEGTLHETRDHDNISQRLQDLGYM